VFAEILHLIYRFLLASKTARKAIHSQIKHSKAEALALIHFHRGWMAAKENDNKIET